MKDDKITGGCACGAVRYEATGRPSNTMVCHCRTCRRVTGAPVVAAYLIAERLGFELRSEVNNVTNTPQWGNPRTDVTNARTFGTINTGANPRTVRFTARLSF